MSVFWRRTVSVAAASIVLLTMLSLSLSPSFSPAANAQTHPTISLNSDSVTVAGGDEFYVDVVVAGISEVHLNDVDLLLRFPGDILEALDVVPGSLLCSSPCGLGAYTISNDIGEIHFDVGLLYERTVNHSGTIARIHFRAIAPGNGTIVFEMANLYDGSNLPIPCSADPSTPADDTCIGEESSVAVTEGPTDTPSPTPTQTSATSPTPTPTAGATRTPAATKTAKPTNTPKPTATPKVTQTPQPPQDIVETSTPVPPASAVQSASSGGGLPSAGTGYIPKQMWRWFFLAGAVVLGLATWAFTFRFYARQKEHEHFWHR